MSVARRFWPAWLLVHTLLFGIFRAILGLSDCASSGLFFSQSFVFIFLAGITGGAVLAGAQWLVLRQSLPVSAFTWILASLAGWLAGALFTVVILLLFIRSLTGEQIPWWLIIPLITALPFSAVGLVQGRLLRSKAQPPLAALSNWIWRYGLGGLLSLVVLLGSVLIIQRDAACSQKYGLFDGSTPAAGSALLMAGLSGLLIGLFAGLLFSVVTGGLFAQTRSSGSI